MEERAVPGPRIACQALVPTQASVGTLCSSQHQGSIPWQWLDGHSLQLFYVDPLCAQSREPRASERATTCIAPHQIAGRFLWWPLREFSQLLPWSDFGAAGGLQTLADTADLSGLVPRGASAQTRQSPILAEKHMRRLPLRSGMRLRGRSSLPAGQRSVASSTRAKSLPEKRRVDWERGFNCLLLFSQSPSEPDLNLSTHPARQ